MFSTRNFVLALLAMPFAAAIPAPSDAAAEVADAPFSFESWAISLSRGEPTLSVEEAIAAAGHSQESSLPGRSLVDHPLEKRLRCFHLSRTPAWGPDAVQCINQLARNGRMCRVETNIAMCTIGRSQIYGAKVGTNQAYTESTCEHVARAAGSIMDSCYRPDDTVQGDHYAYGNGNLLVGISSPMF